MGLTPNKKGAVDFHKAKKILNQGKEFYTDEEIVKILQLINMWALINARTIINKEAKRLLPPV